MTDVEIYSDIGCSKWSPSMLEAWPWDDCVYVRIDNQNDSGSIRLNKEQLEKLIVGLQNILGEIK